MQPQQVGLFGIGLLGHALAQRLLLEGFEVLGYDPRSERRDALLELGGRSASDPLEISQLCSVAIVAVFDTDQVEQVVERAPGFEGSAIRTAICMSTCDPDRIAALAARMAERGVALLEVPVSGTSAQVARGEGVALVAGDSATAQSTERLISAICPRHYYLGPAGNGGRAKLVINLMLGINRAAVAEGLAFAERLGLPRARMLEVARGSAAYSQVMDVKGSLWSEDRFDRPMSRVDQSLKDFTLMCEIGARLGQPLPFAALYAQLLSDCIAHGEAAQDNAILINAIRRLRQSSSPGDKEES